VGPAVFLVQGESGTGSPCAGLSVLPKDYLTTGTRCVMESFSTTESEGVGARADVGDRAGDDAVHDCSLNGSVCEAPVRDEKRSSSRRHKAAKRVARPRISAMPMAHSPTTTSVLMTTSGCVRRAKPRSHGSGLNDGRGAAAGATPRPVAPFRKPAA